MLRQAEYDQRMAYMKASPEMFPGFQAVFAREAERFVKACSVLDPERKAGTGYRLPKTLGDGFGGFDEGKIIDDNLGDTLAVANDAAKNLDHLAGVRNMLALGPEPDVKGALSMAHVAVGGRYKVAARYSFGDGGDHRKATNSWWSLVLMPGVTALRMQSPEDMAAELERAIGKPQPIKINAPESRAVLLRRAAERAGLL